MRIGAGVGAGVLAGCIAADEDDTAPGGGDEEEGIFRLLISDQPADIGDFEQADVSFDHARIFKSQAASDDSDDSGDMTEYEATITVEYDDEPIDDATVEVYEPGGARWDDAHLDTDESGIVSVDRPPGEYVLVVDHESEVGITLLELSGEPTDVTVSFDEERSLAVTVEDEEGEPIGDATVAMLGDDVTWAEFETDDAGTIEIQVPDDPLTIEARALGYDNEQPDIADDADSVSLVLSSLDTHSTTITVENDAGETIEGATVVFVDDTGMESDEWETDEDGEVEGGLWEGEYSVIASYDEAVGSETVTVPDDTDVSITIEEDAGESDDSNPDEQDRGYYHLDLDGETVDLTEVIGDAAISVFEGTLSAGTYNKIELHVADVDATLDGDNGDEVEVNIPSDRLQLTKSFELQAGETVAFVFDIHVVRRGRSGSYNLRPVISESGVGGEDVAVDELTDDDTADVSTGSDDRGGGPPGDVPGQNNRNDRGNQS